MTRFLALPGMLVFLGLCGASASCIAAPAPAAPEVAAIAARLHADMQHPFALAADLKLDPELRAEGERIAAEHLARLKQLLPDWVAQEQRVQTAAGGKRENGALFSAVLARLVNELAIWQLAPGDAQYEQATLAAITSTPLVCRVGDDFQTSDLAGRMLRVQAMPAAQRAHALATERRMLEGWGKPHGALPDWPVRLPEEAAMTAIAGFRAGGPPPPLALPPLLASRLLALGQPYQGLPWETSCLVQQWWLRTSLAQGMAPAAALNAYRYGTLLTATDRFGEPAAPGADDASLAAPGARPPYPLLARRFDVTGSTTISRRFDAAGKPVQASITGRKITVRGIRDVRPVAFENIFDAPSLRFALARPAPAPDGARAPEEFRMNWNLDPPAAPPARAARSPQGAKP